MSAPSPTGPFRNSTDSTLIVRRTSTPAISGSNLINAYAKAKTLTPNGAALSATNPAYIVLQPGLYDITSVGAGLSAAAARAAVNAQFDNAYVYIVCMADHAAEQTVVRIASEVTTEPPLGLEKCLYGPYLQIGTNPAVPTYGYVPAWPAMARAGVGSRLQRKTQPALVKLSVPNNYTASGPCTVTNDTTNGAAYPAPQKIMATGVAGTQYPNPYTVLGSAVDCTNCVIKIRLYVHPTDADSLTYIQIALRDTGNRFRYFTVWGPLAGTYYSPSGWYEIATPVTRFESEDASFDIANVKQVWWKASVAANKTSAWTIEKVNVYAQDSIAKVMVNFDDARDTAFDAVSYCLSKGVRPVLWVFGRAVDQGAAGYMTVAQLRRLHDAGALICNHSYHHIVTRYGAGTTDDGDQIGDYLRQQWWLAKNGLGGPGMRFFATPGGGWIKDPLWFSVADYVRYTVFPYTPIAPSTILDVPYGYTNSVDSAANATTALSNAIADKTFCNTLWHLFGAGGVADADFRTWVDAIVTARTAGTLQVVTPLDLV